jgi:hypothetical protein
VERYNSPDRANAFLVFLEEILPQDKFIVQILFYPTNSRYASSSYPSTSRFPRTTTGRRIKFGCSAIIRIACARVGGFSFIFRER